MLEEPPPPIFTLRGHPAGVTAITQFELSNQKYLASGDEKGNVIIWDLSVFRKVIDLPELCISRVQSLRVISLKLNGLLCQILVAQSRDDGVQLYNLDDVFQAVLKSPTNPIVIYPTYTSLFSRGDSISISPETAILAYPSSLEDNLVTVRYVGDDAKTSLSGSAKRDFKTTQGSCTIFDIIIRPSNLVDVYNLYVGYEDSHICIYSFNQDSTESIPVLNCTGLKLDLINSFDFGFQDFVSAFDVITKMSDNIIVAGSPHKEVIVLSNESDSHIEKSRATLALKRPGVSALAIRPDNKLVTIATWSGTVELYSMKSKRHLATLRNHQKRVECILYLKDSWLNEQTLSHSSETPEKYLICCASSEGTISISSIY